MDNAQRIDLPAFAATIPAEQRAALDSIIDEGFCVANIVSLGRGTFCFTFVPVNVPEGMMHISINPDGSKF